MKCISDIQHAFYINLESRPDRKSHVERQLHSIGLRSFSRFNAVKMPNGAIGCTMSHLKLLSTAKAEGWDHILIVEDDILFTNPILFATQFNAFLSKHGNHLDVALIAGNNVGEFKQIDNTCVQITKCQTTTGYLVKQHYYDQLIHNIKTGLLFLMKEPENHRLYAIDKFWFHLQGKDKWFLITPLSVIQREDYSDIEKRHTNYSNMMLMLDKSALMTRIHDAKLLKSLGTFHF